MLTPDISAMFDEVTQHFMPKQPTQPGVLNEQYKDDVWKFEVHKHKLVSLESDWGEIIRDTQNNRDDRYMDVDVKRLRTTGELLPDEIVDVKRVIHNNVSREKGPYMSYLTQPRRSLVLHCTSDPRIKSDVQEKEFTRVSRYKNWTRSYFKCLDGGQVQGWSAIQTKFDLKMPGHFKRKYIARDRLLFPKRTVDLDKVEYIVIIIDVTMSQLTDWVEEFGFDEEQVRMVVQKEGRGDVSNTKEEIVTIREIQYKAKDGTVMCGYYNVECTDWLKQPEPLYLGIQEKQVQPIESGLGPLHLELQGAMQQQPVLQKVYEKEYNVDIYIYVDDECETIVEHKGRAFLDKYVQIAQTCIWSSFINKLVRSSNTYGSPKNSDPNNVGVPKIEKAVKLVNGAFYSSAVEFWAFPAPDMTAVAASQAISSENANDMQQTAFQVINRKDSRKTKEELKQAEDQQHQITSVPLTLWADFVTSVESKGWRIVQSRAKNGLLPEFMAVPPAAQENGAANVALEQQARQYLLDQIYDCRAAGDVDYIERKEKVQTMQAFWPLVASTGLSGIFLGDLLVTAFPDDGPRWQKTLMDTAQQPSVIKALVTAMQGVLKEYGPTMKPDEIAGINQVLQQALQSLGMESQPKSPTINV